MQPSPNTIPVAYRPPFAFGHMPYRDARPHGETVLEIVHSVPSLPREFLSRGVVCINGEQVPRELWSYTRPKPTSDNLPIAVTLHFPLASPGGGGSGGSGSSKSIIALVAAVALIAVAAVIAGPVGAGLLGSFGTATFLGITGAQLVAGAVSIAGALAISALTAPPTTQDAATGALADTNTENRDPSGAQGNVVNPGGAIPRVIGTRKVYPPFICEPLVELVDKDEFVEALVALNGPHLLEDIRIDGVSITDAEDVEYETREGWSTDTPVTLVTRQARTITPQLTLSDHVTETGKIKLLHSGTTPEDDLPIWHGVVTRNSPNEIWLHFLLPGGLFLSTGRMRVPFRIRMRLRGTSTWINLPEVHYANDSSNQQRLAILMKWEAAPATSTVPGTNGWVYARLNPTSQTVTPATPVDRVWNANSYFDDGSGSDYLNFGSEATSAVRNMNLFLNRVEFYLDTATFPVGIYEIEIKRGCSFTSSTFTDSSYQLSGTVTDLFWYRTITGDDRAPFSQVNVSDNILLTRVMSVWNEAPYVPADKYFSLIAIKARNRSIQRLSVQASGYVKDYDGSSPGGWNTWTTTSNPAPHYVDILSGEQNLDPLDTDLRDDAGLVAWRTLCAANDWTCDTIVDDMRTQDVLSLLASCGYAKPYQSDIYGVTVDNDRSAESPVQVFSRINATNVKFERAFIRAPEGFVVTYRDESSDDDRAQTIVYQTDLTVGTTGLFETIAYDGLIDTDKVEARASFDLNQTIKRSTFYSLETDIEAIVCRRGSLVALQHDVLTSRAGDGHVYTKTLSGPNITGVVLDATIDIVSGNTGVAIRHTDGSITTHTLSNVTGTTSTLTFTTPFTDDGTILGYNDTNREYGSIVVAGELGTEYKRMLVAQVTATKDLKASLVLVDEAPDLVRF